MTVDILIIRKRYLDSDVVDGDVREAIFDYEFREDLDLGEAIQYTRREGVSFAATGNTWAADPDGSTVIDYATGMREEVSVHPQGAWHPWEYDAWVAGVEAKPDNVLTFERFNQFA